MTVDLVAMVEGALLDVHDETQPMERRILRGVEHLIRFQHHYFEQMEMKMTAIQDQLDALAKRIDDDTTAIQDRLNQPVETVDTTGLEASVARLDAVAAPAAPEPAPAPAAANTSQFQPLYVVDGDANTDPTQWTQLAGYTTPDGRPVFTFVNDEAVVGAGATGDGVAGVWHLYSGDLTVTA